MTKIISLNKGCTVQKAKELANNLLKDMPVRLAHTEGVVQTLIDIMEELTVPDAFRQKCIMAAYLHDIGYCEAIAHTGFHPYDGYIYLKDNQWDEDVCQAVLHHSYAHLLLTMKMQMGVLTEKDKHLPEELFKIMQNHPVVYKNDLIHFVTCADLQTAPTGERVTFLERLADVGMRYGTESLYYKHLHLIEYSIERRVRLLKKKYGQS